MVSCPNCQTPLVEVATYAPDSALEWVLRPQPGHLLNARTVGQSLVQLRLLLRAASKEVGGKVEVFVGSASMKDGELRIGLRVLDIALGSAPPPSSPDAAEGEI